MSLTNPLPRATRTSAPYLADGVNAIYAVPFWFLDPLDLVVQINTAGVYTVLRGGVGYTANNLGNPGGGLVTLSAVPTAGAIVTIFGRRTPSRMTSVFNGGQVVAAAIDMELDVIEATMQELRRDLDNLNNAVFPGQL